MTVNKYGAKEGSVVLSVKDGGFSFSLVGIDQLQAIYLRFDKNPWIRRLFWVNGGAMTAFSGAETGTAPMRGKKEGAKAILEGLERNHRHLQIRWVPLYGPSYRIATLNIDGYGEASAKCKRRVAAVSLLER